MLLTLVRKEFLELVMSFRFMVTTILCVLLAITSVYVLIGDYSVKKLDYHSNQAAYHQQAQQEGSVRNLERHGVRVEREPARLQVSAFGLEKDPDKTFQVSTTGVPTTSHDMNINPVLSLFPVADLLFVVATVLSLLTFVNSYNSISGERESETLKLLMSYSIPRDRLILAKWLGGFVGLCIPFLTAILLASIIIAISSALDFAASDWAAFGVGILVSLVFIASMFSIGLFVSSACRSSATSIAILVVIWVVFVLITPNVSPFLAEQISPSIPLSVVEGDVKQERGNIMQNFMKGMWRDRNAMMEAMRKGGQEGDAARAQLMKKFDDARATITSQIDSMEKEKFDGYDRRQHNLISVTKNVSRLSPVASYVYTITDLATTGIRKQFNFYEKLKAYQRDFKTYVSEKIKKAGSSGMPFSSQDEDYDVSDLPVFKYEEEAVQRRVAESMIDLGIIGSYAVLFFLASFVAFLRAEII